MKLSALLVTLRLVVPLVVLVLRVETEGAPMDYLKDLSPAVHAVRRQARAFDVGADPKVVCGDQSNGQKMWFAEKQQCSVASRNMTYLYQFSTDLVPRVLKAKKGDLIFMQCDNAECPPPPRPDCYTDPSVVCADDEYCMVNWRERWGAWAMDSGKGGRTGYTPLDYCGDYGEFMERLKKANVTLGELGAEAQQFYEEECLGTNGITQDNAGSSAHGRCVKYRQEQQSCEPELELVADDSWGFDSEFVKKEDGKQYMRPMRCAPDLVCSGPDFDPAPNTCLKQRPADKCFMGSWWVGDKCPRTSTNEIPSRGGGLTKSQVMDTIKAALRTFPGEIGTAGSCKFWDYSHPVGKRSLKSRKRLFNIVGALWPKRLLGKPPSFQSIEEDINIVLKFGAKQCYAAEATSPQVGPENFNFVPGANKVLDALMNSFDDAFRPQMLWSLVHFLTFNLDDQITFKQAAASRALASWLSENFLCTDCRGFFTIGIMETYGPPSADELTGKYHMTWWWNAHNTASEHVASIRGGHPWQNQFQDDDAKRYQNPYYMPFAVAYKQWKVLSPSETRRR